MSAALPLDHDVRERVIRAERNLCVEAGAGTGKTTLMVARVLHLLRTGRATIDRIVLISFTEKAAAELRARLRDALEAALDEPGTVAEQQRLDVALAGLDSAHVETIHAFAAWILRAHPIEAGVSPDLQPLDDLGAALGWDAAWEEWLAGQLAGDPPPLRRALELGLDLGRVRELAEYLHAERALLPLAWQPPPEPDRAELFAAIQREAGALRDLAAHCVDTNDEAFRRSGEIDRWAERLHLDPTFDRAVLNTPPFGITTRTGAKTRWAGDSLARVRELAEVLQSRIADAQAAMRQRALADLASWLERFVDAYAEQRRRDGVADFDDLLIWTRDLVRGDRAVRAALQRRFDALIVDEFQDTDPLQVEIIAYLAEDGAHATRWQDVRLAAAKMCIVGDPKQAIYRFRRADVAIYAAAKDVIGADGLERITQSFRSVEPLLTWVNRVFAAVIVEDITEQTQPAYVPLAAAHPAHAGLDRPPVVLLPVADDAASAAGQRRAEAAAIAGAIQRLIAEHWPVRDALTGEQRPAEYRDVALLFPVTSDLEVYEEALAGAGVPYRFEGSGFFYRRQEVRDLSLCIAAVDDPTDEIAVVGALKSAAFVIADERLLLFKAAGGEFNPLTEAPPGFEDIGRAFGMLRELYASRNLRGIGAVVDEIITRTRLAELSLPRADGRQAVANLLKVADQARAFDGRPGGTFRTFARWLAATRERTPREAESPVTDDAEQVVRMLTVHAAKGLEFPIVILANLGAERRRSETWIADRAGGGVEFRLGPQDSGWRTAGFDLAQEREGRHAAAESRRLLYVACTRARDHLVLPFRRVPDQSFGGCLAPLLPDLPSAMAGTSIDDQFVSAGIVPVATNGGVSSREVWLAGDAASGLAARASWLAERRRVTEAGRE